MLALPPFNRLRISCQRNIMKANLLIDVKKVVAMTRLKMSQRKVMPDTHTLREFSDISRHESAKDKISEANLNLERIITLFQAIEKMFFPKHKCCTLHWVARLCGHD